jgi:Flp pilus assembly protein TadD
MSLQSNPSGIEWQDSKAAPNRRSRSVDGVARRWAGLLAALVLLAACEGGRPAPAPTLALPDRSTGDPAEQGWSALVATRLRALPGLRLVIDPAGCAGGDASHALGLSRRNTGSSEITAFELVRCADGLVRHQSFVTPLTARRDWSAPAAWWVAGELGLAGRQPGDLRAVGERPMLDYLSAIGHLTRRTASDVASARDLLRAVVRREPDFADGHAQLAVAELLASEYGLAGTADALHAAGVAIEHALTLDPGNGLARGARGLALMVEGRYRDALSTLIEAHRLEPGHDAILLWLGNAYLYSGQPEAARPWLATVLEINADLDSARISLAEADCLSGREEPCHAFLGEQARSPMQSFVTALLHGHRLDYAAALAQLERDSPEVDPAWIAQLRNEACRALGQDDCATLAVAGGLDDLPEADLWRLDLGFAAFLADPERRARHREGLLSEVTRLRDGGIRLAVLDGIEDCLDAAPSRERDARVQRLLGCAPLVSPASGAPGPR